LSNCGRWKLSGHICPKVSNDQFLFVTLNKQGAEADYRYHDYFRDPARFHWESQNGTTPENKKGKGIIEHEKDGGRIHLFVRKHKKLNNRPAPFYSCGTVAYQSHTGSGPMSVEYKLNSPLPEELHAYFG
jgi:hypothetical protein